MVQLMLMTVSIPSILRKRLTCSPRIPRDDLWTIIDLFVLPPLMYLAVSTKCHKAVALSDSVVISSLILRVNRQSATHSIKQPSPSLYLYLSSLLHTYSQDGESQCSWTEN
jgi:hypothetical protein